MMRVSLISAARGAGCLDDRWLDRLVRAEEQGHARIWLLEAPLGAAVPATLACAALAARTQRARIGALLALPEALHPLRVAEDLAMLDVVSDGRADVGLRCDLDLPVERLPARIAAVRDAWRDPAANPPEAPEIEPRPVQPAGPGLFVAGSGAAFAGHERWGFIAGLGGSVDEVAADCSSYREAACDEPAAQLALVVDVRLEGRPQTLLPPGAPSLSVAGSRAACTAAIEAWIERFAPDELLVCHDDAVDPGAAQDWFAHEIAPALA